MPSSGTSSTYGTAAEDPPSKPAEPTLQFAPPTIYNSVARINPLILEEIVEVVKSYYILTLRHHTILEEYILAGERILDHEPIEQQDTMPDYSPRSSSREELHLATVLDPNYLPLRQGSKSPDTRSRSPFCSPPSPRPKKRTASENSLRKAIFESLVTQYKERTKNLTPRKQMEAKITAAEDFIRISFNFSHLADRKRLELPLKDAHQTIMTLKMKLIYHVGAKPDKYRGGVCLFCRAGDDEENNGMVEWATLPCTHGFHLDCLSDWIDHGKCVVCKMPLAVGPVGPDPALKVPRRLNAVLLSQLDVRK
jgi:hypothetical protein